MIEVNILHNKYSSKVTNISIHTQQTFSDFVTQSPHHVFYVIGEQKEKLEK